jgi:hypothetical protein
MIKTCDFCNEKHNNYYPSYYSQFRKKNFEPLLELNDEKIYQYTKILKKLYKDDVCKCKECLDNCPTIHMMKCQQYYKNLYEICKTNKFSFTDFIENSSPEKDAIMLEYVKSRKNCFVISIWNAQLSKLNKNKLYNILKKYGCVYYIKLISFTKKELGNLMYFMYDEYAPSRRITIIKKKLDRVHANENNNNIIFVILDNIYNIDISGTNSAIKNKIRKKVKKYMHSKLAKCDILHINDYFYQTVEYCEILLNPDVLNTLSDTDLLIN